MRRTVAGVAAPRGKLCWSAVVVALVSVALLQCGPSEPAAEEGGGRATLVGPTNVGKSLLLVRATGAKAKVGAYALSTQEPVPGMLPYKDLRIQLVDTPPISTRAPRAGCTACCAVPMCSSW